LLTMAAQCGHRGMVQFLLDHGADAFHVDAVSGDHVVAFYQPVWGSV